MVIGVPYYKHIELYPLHALISFDEQITEISAPGQLSVSDKMIAFCAGIQNLKS